VGLGYLEQYLLGLVVRGYLVGLVNEDQLDLEVLKYQYLL
jgi:hypothetical protein